MSSERPSWWKRSNADLSIRESEELQLSNCTLSLTPTFELYIWLCCEDFRYATRHRFVDRPDNAAVNYLVGEAKKLFFDLFDREPNEGHVHVYYLRKKDRESLAPSA